MLTSNNIVFSTRPPAPPATENTARLTGILSRFEPISLAEMDGVALMNRTDTKYVLNVNQLYSALSALSPHYRALDIQGVRLSRYRTAYFDTADFLLYRQHHARRQNRCKVRSREYVDSGLAFLEVKLKTNQNRTIKERISTPALLTRFPPETANFINRHCSLPAAQLHLKLWNNFGRITLVGKDWPERVTLDLGLQFYTAGRFVTWPGVVIAEVKQDGINRRSAFIQQMRANHIHPHGFSKYCVGVSALYPHVKHNNFKPDLQRVSKIMQGALYV